ncbi:MAG: hypothetical protein Faunusvirus11_15 [Faunusvirus sp.]|jgi:hypothetical protein|uniref:BTB domain-containing protein n=1 Tax=Faunusvirus sp. TaxID=2487766 RepID=A0A3G4ZWU4_9VIRU|nr:MAG: hypothetical protein Faunusvirus11_15 [Faunusvirus sp.]
MGTTSSTLSLDTPSEIRRAINIETKKVDMAMRKKLLSSNNGDTTINLSNDEQIKVFSYILAEKSPAFKRILSNDTRESGEHKIDMTIYNSEAVRYMIEYIYCEQISEIKNMKKKNDMKNIKNMKDMKIDIFFELSHLAEMYDVTTLCDYLEPYIMGMVKQNYMYIIKCCTETTFNKFITKIYDKCVDKIIDIFKNKADIKREHSDLCCRHYDSGRIRNKYDYYKIDKKYACICHKLKTILQTHNLPTLITHLGPEKSDVKQFNYHMEGKLSKIQMDTSFCCEHGSSKAYIAIHIKLYNEIYNAILALPEDYRNDILRTIIVY